MESKVLLADIGNTHIHIYDGKNVEHCKIEDAIERYAQQKIKYISVNHAYEEEIKSATLWINISPQIKLEGSYEGMGVDRRALCLSRDNGLLIDAGSAITVDYMKDSLYQGGYILPGLSAILKTYANISPALETTLNRDICLDKLPLTTRDGISYGIIAPIKALLEGENNANKIFFTGGDGAFLSTLFQDAIYDEKLLFQGMQKALESTTLDKDSIDVDHSPTKR